MSFALWTLPPEMYPQVASRPRACRQRLVFLLLLSADVPLLFPFLQHSVSLCLSLPLSNSVSLNHFTLSHTCPLAQLDAPGVRFLRDALDQGLLDDALQVPRPP